MDKKPYPMIPAKNDNTYLYIFSYSGDEEDFDVDKAAFDAELKTHFQYANTVAIPENGIGLTGSDLTIGASTTSRTIACATATSVLHANCVKYPIVLYKGNPIPFSDFLTSVSALGLITLALLTTTKYPSTTATDYKVYWSDHVMGTLVSAEVGGVTLPIESSSFKAVGHVEPVVFVSRRGDAEGTGSIQVIMSLTSILFSGGTSPQNFAGEELYKRIYGANWAYSNQGFALRNRLDFNTLPFGIAVLMHSGLPLVSGVANKVWGNLLCIYHCQLTSIGAPANVSADTTDPILINVEFKSKYAVPEYSTLLTT